MNEPLTLTVPPQLVRALAEEVVDVLEERGITPGPSLVDAANIARRFGLSREWVYDHAEEFGAIRVGPVGDGKKPRLRFDPERVAKRIAGDGKAESAEPRPAPPKARARRSGTNAGVPLLEINRARPHAG